MVKGRPWQSAAARGYNRWATHPRAGPVERKVFMVKSVEFRRAVLLVGFWAGCAAGAAADDIEEGYTLFRTGRYDECQRLADAEIRSGFWDERWAQLKIESELARGKDPEALA